jgi:hypothetical protein|tara:strand:- start:536 stop:898 length:363 start_codon:yes stop_codon:yes gene_type:complete
MAYVLGEVTERALVPYVKEKVVESGVSTIIVKWLPWSGVVVQSVGLSSEVYYGLTYSGGVSWLVRKIIYWCFPQTKAFIITGRCLSFISGLVASTYAAGTVTFPLLLTGTIGSLRTLLRD